MAFGLKDNGETYVLKNNLDGATLTLGVYNSSDNLPDSAELADITTEPSNTSYSPQSVTFSVGTTDDNDALLSSDSPVTYDFTDLVSQTEIDAYYISDGAGQLLATGQMSELANGSRTRIVGGGATQTFNLEAGAGFSLD
jgi:hypothetical protein